MLLGYFRLIECSFNYFLCNLTMYIYKSFTTTMLIQLYQTGMTKQLQTLTSSLQCYDFFPLTMNCAADLTSRTLSCSVSNSDGMSESGSNRFTSHINISATNWKFGLRKFSMEIRRVYPRALIISVKSANTRIQYSFARYQKI